MGTKIPKDEFRKIAEIFDIEDEDEYAGCVKDAAMEGRVFIHKDSIEVI